MAYLLTYFIAVVIAAEAWNQLSLLSVFVIEKNGSCGILGLGLVCLWPWLNGFGLGHLRPC